MCPHWGLVRQQVLHMNISTDHRLHNYQPTLDFLECKIYKSMSLQQVWRTQLGVPLSLCYMLHKQALKAATNNQTTLSALCVKPFNKSKTQ